MERQRDGLSSLRLSFALYSVNDTVLAIVPSCHYCVFVRRFGRGLMATSRPGDFGPRATPIQPS